MTWLALLPCWKKALGSGSPLACVGRSTPAYLPQSKIMHIRLTDDSKLSVGVLLSVTLLSVSLC